MGGRRDFRVVLLDEVVGLIICDGRQVSQAAKPIPFDVNRAVDLREEDQGVSAHRPKDEQDPGEARATETASHDAWMKMKWTLRDTHSKNFSNLHGLNHAHDAREKKGA